MTGHSLALPGGRTLTLDGSLGGRLVAGVVCLAGVHVRVAPAVWQQTEALGAELAAAHAGKAPSEIAALTTARDLYRSFGMDPSRYRPSSEALLRRVLNGRGLYRLNNAVDCCNLASLRFLLPIGMYDLARVEGDITVRVGAAGERYPGIRKGPVNLEGRLGLFDARGGFGSPTSDSERTSVTERTVEILAVVMAAARYPIGRLQEHTTEFAALFARHCGARAVATGVLRG
jgi:DNA/RNA-binding domain of Phe-tRNA-synthetase-like protein